MTRLLAPLLIIAAVALLGLPLLMDPDNTGEQVQFDPQPRTERIVDLPEDGDLWQLVLVYGDKARDPRDRQLAAMFASTPRLQSLVAQTKVYEYSPSHFWVTTHLGGNATPAVVLQAVAPGKNTIAKIVYKASWPNLPEDGELLANEIQSAIETRHPELVAKRLARDCPNCPPARPNDQRRPSSPRIPDIRPKPGMPGLGGNDSTVVLLLLGGAAVAALASSGGVKK